MKVIYNHLEFHNVAELEAVDGLPGFRLQRFPREVRNCLGHKEHERGRFFGQRSVGCEIRFVTDARFFRITLSAVEGDGNVFVYKGNFLHSHHPLKAGVVTTLHLEEPPKFGEVKTEALEGYAFSSGVWRLLFGKDCCITFLHIDTFGHGTRPPEKRETPRLKWLAYGSSITFGGDTVIYSNAYVQQAARRIKADVLNKGMAGSCFCDEAMVHYLAENEEWDFATLELGVNMRGRFTAEEYEQRVRYLIDTMLHKNPEKPVIVIGIYPNGAEYALNPENAATRSNTEFNRITEKLVAEKNNPRLYFIEGKDILTDYSGLSVDLLHPSDEGHILMGENLAMKLKAILEFQ